MLHIILDFESVKWTNNNIIWELRKIEKPGAPECHFYLLVSGNTILLDCIKFPIKSICQICSGTWQHLEISLQCLQIRWRSILGALLYHAGSLWVSHWHFLWLKLYKVTYLTILVSLFCSWSLQLDNTPGEAQLEHWTNFVQYWRELELEQFLYLFSCAPTTMSFLHGPCFTSCHHFKVHCHGQTAAIGNQWKICQKHIYNLMWLGGTLSYVFIGLILIMRHMRQMCQPPTCPHGSQQHRNSSSN